MSLENLRFLDDVSIRCYLASLIGPSRAPFGSRSSVVAQLNQPVMLVRNSTQDRALYVTVSRGPGANAQGIFSKNDSPSSNDYAVAFPSAAVFRFVLRPGEQLSYLSTSGPLALVWGQEAF